MSSETFLLFEAAPGLLLFRVKEWDSIAQDTEGVQDACTDPQRFKQLVSTEAFYPFSDAADALETLMGVASGSVPPAMQKFLELHMPAGARGGKEGKKKKHAVGEDTAECALGVCDAALGKALSEMGYKIIYSPSMLELHRGVRMHLRSLSKQLKSLPLAKFQVGLGHSYSRELMQVDPRKQDKPIMQSVALIDSLDKTINSFAMKLKEWYGWHFPELIKIVPDIEAYCRTVLAVKQKDLFDEQESGDKLLAAVGNNEEIAAEVIAATKHSMGQEVSEEDFLNIERFAQQLLHLCEQRKSLQEYLSGKMDVVSPNLKAVVGEVLGARLISHAGALVSLAKYPASTIQILGAEKALFRALKARSGRTPKYGYLSDGVVPRKNLDVMREAAAEVEAQRAAEAKALKKAKKKKAAEEAAAAAAAAAGAAHAEDEAEFGAGEKKKRKTNQDDLGEEEGGETGGEIRKKKKKKQMQIEVEA
ncbi:hypothetical protein Emed_002021 [Eimeria media]